jgi:Protein tyrosine and serine/threonine kinase
MSPVAMENQLKIVYNWTAPEVLAGHPCSVSSDIYSLCAVLWEVNNGRQRIVVVAL